MEIKGDVAGSSFHEFVGASWCSGGGCAGDGGQRVHLDQHRTLPRPWPALRSLPPRPPGDHRHSERAQSPAASGAGSALAIHRDCAAACRSAAGQAGRCEIVLHEHAEHSGHRARSRGVDRQQPSMRMAATHHHRIGLAGKIQIIGVTPFATQKLGVFLARYRLAHGKFLVNDWLASNADVHRFRRAPFSCLRPRVLGNETRVRTATEGPAVHPPIGRRSSCGRSPTICTDGR